MKKRKEKINPENNLAEILEKYPILEETLIYEFGIICANCAMQGYDTLREAAEYHDIFEEDFEEMIQRLNDVINDN